MTGRKVKRYTLDLILSFGRPPFIADPKFSLKLMPVH